MTRQQKLGILNGLLERAREVTYESRDEMIRCKDDLKTFIRNAISKDSIWINRIGQISWSLHAWSSYTPESSFAKAWESGKTEFIGVLNSIISEIELFDEQPADSKIGIKSNKVFVVHGHNDTMKLAVARIIEKLGLEPIILHEQPNKGRTIIEKLERLSQDVSFAVVLLSADDKMDDGKYRARQNVVLELGYFISKLGRENVVALYDISSGTELLDIPSDISGVLYEPYDKPDGSWRYEVVQELQAAGFSVDANSLL